MGRTILHSDSTRNSKGRIRHTLKTGERNGYYQGEDPNSLLGTRKIATSGAKPVTSPVRTRSRIKQCFSQVFRSGTRHAFWWMARQNRPFFAWDVRSGKAPRWKIHIFRYGNSGSGTCESSGESLVAIARVSQVARGVSRLRSGRFTSSATGLRVAELVKVPVNRSLQLPVFLMWHIGYQGSAPEDSHLPLRELG